MGIWDNSGIFGIFDNYGNFGRFVEIEEIVKIENARNVEDIVKIVFSVFISNSQILDMYEISMQMLLAFSFVPILPLECGLSSSA